MIFIILKGSINITDGFARVTLKHVSYDLHGFNQGFLAVQDLISICNPDVFFLQERLIILASLTLCFRIIFITARSPCHPL